MCSKNLDYHFQIHNCGRGRCRGDAWQMSRQSTTTWVYRWNILRCCSTVKFFGCHRNSLQLHCRIVLLVEKFPRILGNFTFLTGRNVENSELTTSTWIMIVHERGTSVYWNLLLTHPAWHAPQTLKYLSKDYWKKTWYAIFVCKY